MWLQLASRAVVCSTVAARHVLLDLDGRSLQEYTSLHFTTSRGKGGVSRRRTSREPFSLHVMFERHAQLVGWSDTLGVTGRSLPLRRLPTRNRPGTMLPAAPCAGSAPPTPTPGSPQLCGTSGFWHA